MAVARVGAPHRRAVRPARRNRRYRRCSSHSSSSAICPALRLRTSGRHHRGSEDFVDRAPGEGRPDEFLASWCLECRPEMLVLESLHRELAGPGLAIVGVNARETTDTVRRYAKDVGLTFPLVLDPDGTINARYGVLGLPTTFLWPATDMRWRSPSDLANGAAHQPERCSMPCWPRPRRARPDDDVPSSRCVLARRVAGRPRAGGQRGRAAQRTGPVRIGVLTESWGPTAQIVGLRTA